MNRYYIVDNKIRVKVFDNYILLSKSFVKTTKLAEIISSGDVDVGAVIRDVVMSTMTRNIPIVTTLLSSRTTFIAKFLKLLDSYYTDDTKEQGFSLINLLDSYIINEFGANAQLVSPVYIIHGMIFDTVIIKIIDFLDIDDRLLLHTDDWMNTVNKIYQYLLSNLPPSSVNVKLYVPLERYILPNKIKQQSFGERLLQSERFNVKGQNIRSSSPIRRILSSEMRNRPSSLREIDY